MFRLKSGQSNSKIPSDFDLESATHNMPEMLTPTNN